MFGRHRSTCKRVCVGCVPSFPMLAKHGFYEMEMAGTALLDLLRAPVTGTPVLGSRK